MEQIETVIIPADPVPQRVFLQEKIGSFLSKVKSNRIIPLASVGLLSIGVIATVVLSQQQQVYQQRASAINGLHDSGVLVLEYFPENPHKSGYLDPEEMSGVVETQDLLSKPITDWENKVDDMVQGQIQFMEEASRFHGYEDKSSPAALTFHVVDTKKYYTSIPRGFRSGDTGPFLPNYGKILKDVNICDYVNNQSVKEVWMFGYHTSKIVPDESRASSKYGTVSNTPVKEEAPEYAPFRMPRCGNSYTLYNYTYQRDLGTMIHDRIHQFENAIPFAEGVWPVNSRNAKQSLFWGSFSEYIQQDTVHNYKSACGNAHYPPNWRVPADNYVYNLQNSTPSNCETWNPDPTKTQYVSTSCTTWGCDELGFYKWWMQNIPGYHNGIVYQGKRMRNWWEAMYDFDGFIERGKSLYCSPQSASEADCSDIFSTPSYSQPSTTPNYQPTPTPVSNQPLPTLTPIPSITAGPVLMNVKITMLTGDGISTTQQVVICFYEYDPDIQPGNDFGCKQAKGKVQTTVTLESRNGQVTYGANNIPLPSSLSTGEEYRVSLKLLHSVPVILPFPVSIFTTQQNSLAALLRSGDLNHDGQVNGDDVTFLLTHCYGNKADTSPCNAADFDDDGKIDAIDYNMLLIAINTPN